MKITMKSARINARLTQAQLAELLGVSVPTVYLWEKGRSDIPAVKFKKFCELVGADMNDIFLPCELILNQESGGTHADNQVGSQ